MPSLTSLVTSRQWATNYSLSHSNSLWCFFFDGVIGVFDLELNHLRDMWFSDIRGVQSAVDVGDEAVVAAKTGLFMVSYAGKIAGLYII